MLSSLDDIRLCSFRVYLGARPRWFVADLGICLCEFRDDICASAHCALARIKAGVLSPYRGVGPTNPVIVSKVVGFPCLLEDSASDIDRT